jgi:mRNA interferase RelE/StbE
MHQLLFSRGVEKFLTSLKKRNSKLFNRFIEAFNEISKNPYCATALVGNLKGYYSYRVGDYRILYELRKQPLKVYVLKIEHRKDVYR